ncbi:hypothetical protein VTG60DRAFT_7195 [Thermothelomyces hinnuleus]
MGCRALHGERALAGRSALESKADVAKARLRYRDAAEATWWCMRELTKVQIAECIAKNNPNLGKIRLKTSKKGASRGVEGRKSSVIGRRFVGDDDAGEDFKIRGVEPDWSKPEAWSLGQAGRRESALGGWCEARGGVTSRDLPRAPPLVRLVSGVAHLNQLSG